MSRDSKSASLRSLELYRSSVDAVSLNVSEGDVSAAYNSTLRALMYLLNFANEWYTCQDGATTDTANLRVANDRVALLIHTLLSRRICDLTGKVVALNVRRRLVTRDAILNKVLVNRKVSDTSAALLFRLENVTAAFKSNPTTADDEAADQTETRTPAGFHTGIPDSLTFIETAKCVGYSELIGVDEQVRTMETHLRASRLAKTSTLVLLYGPPGTGKTSLVLAAAKENALPVVSVATSNLGGEFIGEREQNTADMFDYLETVTSDFVLFVDEADSFLPETYENNTQSRLTRVLTINRVLRLVGRNDGVTRVVMLATNYEERIARDVAESSFKIYLAEPSTDEQMRSLFSFYRNRANVNMTTGQMDFAVRVARTLGYAPGHVALLVQRLATNSIIKLLNNRVELRDVRSDLLEQPIYMMERGMRFEDDRSSVTVVIVSREPRADRDDAVAAAWERGNAVAFPVPDLDVDFESVLSRRRTDTQPFRPPSIISELGLDGSENVLVHVDRELTDVAAVDRVGGVVAGGNGVEAAETTASRLFDNLPSVAVSASDVFDSNDFVLFEGEGYPSDFLPLSTTLSDPADIFPYDQPFEEYAHGRVPNDARLPTPDPDTFLNEFILQHNRGQTHH